MNEDPQATRGRAPVPGGPGTAAAAAWEGTPVAALRQAWGLPLLVFHPRTGSTNDDARALAEGGAEAGTTVLADAQSAGRGRRGRAWADVPGRSLLLSMVWRPTGAAPGAAPLRAGLAVADALSALGVPAVGIKWPNDVLAGGRKVAGILCEGALGGSAPYLVVGVGMNVLQAAEELPTALAPDATSVALALGRTPARLDVAAAVVARLRAAGERATEPLDDGELAALAARDVLGGRRVAVDDMASGVAAGVTADGALRVREERGGEILVRHGTVRPLTTAGEEATP